MTANELELVKLLCLPQKLACDKLGISDNAFRCRTTRLMRKYGVENQRALIVKMVKIGILPIESIEYRDFDGQK